jgi:hypothetical protein
MRTLPRFAVTAVAALAMLLMAAPARAQVMQSVPSDAVVVVKVKNIADVSAKVAALSQQWGLANIRPELNDPLGTLLTAANLGPGLDKAGEAAFAMLDMGGKGGGPRGEPNMVILVPVTDFKAFAGSLPNAKPDGDMMSFSMGGNPQPGFVASWGKYAALSPNKASLAKPGTGLQAAGATAKELASKDVVVYANLKVIRQAVLPMFQQNKAQMLQMIEQQMANAPGANPKYAPVFRAYMGQIFGVAEGFLRDSDGATFGVTLGKDGITTSLVTEFAPDSYAGQAFKGMKNTDASFTAGLPEGKYFVYGGVAIDKAGIQMMNDFIAPIEKEIAALGDEGKPIMAYVAAVKEYFAATKSSTFGLVAPAANAIQQEGVIQMVNVVTGDTAKMLAAQKKMLAVQNEFMALSGIGGLNIKTDYKEGARTIDGIKFDSVTTAMQGQPQTPQEQQAAFLLQMLYGAKGMNAHSGVIGNEKLLMVAGGNDALLTSAVAAAKNNADPLGKGIAQKVSAGLPQNRLGAVYLQVDTITSTVLDVMALRGMPGGVKLPPNLPPLAAAVATEGSALRIDGYIPAQTVQSLIAAGMQMWLQGMQGGGAGQPGGL